MTERERARSSKASDVGGKTGTAEVGRGCPNQVWFIGFAPASNPRVAVAATVAVLDRDRRTDCRPDRPGRDGVLAEVIVKL